MFLVNSGPFRRLPQGASITVIRVLSYTKVFIMSLTSARILVNRKKPSFEDTRHEIHQLFELKNFEP